MTTAIGSLLTVPSVPQVRPLPVRPSEAHGGELGSMRASQISSALMSGVQPAFSSACFEGVDAVVAVGGELVGGLAVALVVLGDEVDGELVGGVRREGGSAPMTPSARLMSKFLRVRMPSMPSTPKKVGS